MNFKEEINYRLQIKKILNNKKWSNQEKAYRFISFFKNNPEAKKVVNIKKHEDFVLQNISNTSIFQVFNWIDICPNANLEKCGEKILQTTDSAGASFVYKFVNKGYATDIKPFEDKIVEMENLEYLIKFAHDIKSADIDRLEGAAMKILKKNPNEIVKKYVYFEFPSKESNILCRTKNNLIDLISDKNRSEFCTTIFLYSAKNSYTYDTVNLILEENKKDLNFDVIIADLIDSHRFYIASQVQDFVKENKLEKQVQKELLDFPAAKIAKFLDPERPDLNIFLKIDENEKQELLDAVINDDVNTVAKYVCKFCDFDHIYNFAKENLTVDKKIILDSLKEKSLQTIDISQIKKPSSYINGAEIDNFIHNMWKHSVEGGNLEGGYFTEPNREYVAKIILEKRFKRYLFETEKATKQNKKADRQKECIFEIEKLFSKKTKAPTLND